MNRSIMIVFLQENPNVKVTHWLFSEDEYICQKEDGKIYDENGYLFEDWYSDGTGKHDGIRKREGGSWQTGWKVKEDSDMCKNLSRTTSGKSYLYNNCCKDCQRNRRCSYV